MSVMDIGDWVRVREEFADIENKATCGAVENGYPYTISRRGYNSITLYFDDGSYRRRPKDRYELVEKNYVKIKINKNRGMF